MSRLGRAAAGVRGVQSGDLLSCCLAFSCLVLRGGGRVECRCAPLFFLPSFLLLQSRAAVRGKVTEGWDIDAHRFLLSLLSLPFGRDHGLSLARLLQLSGRSDIWAH